MTLAEKIATRTPADRDRALDGLRSLALLGVVAGHFLVMALPVRDGALHVASPLAAMPYFAPASWLFQMLGLFFLVGGYAGIRGRLRSMERGEAYGGWLRRRLVRLGRPVLAVTAALGVAVPVLALGGVPAGTLHTAATLVVQPLWFVGVYAVLTALTPVALDLDRRFGAAAPVPALLVVALVDVLRYSPLEVGWVGPANVLFGWFFMYQLGVAWARGRFTRPGAWLLIAAGAVGGAVLIWRFGYPASVVGVPGAVRGNSHPPSLLVLALAAVQCGVAILAAGRLRALLVRPRLWTGVVLVNLSALTILCWHQVASVLLTGLTVPWTLPGLHDAPDSLVWVAARFGWLPVYALILAGVVAATRRFEAPLRVPRAVLAAAGTVAACFAAYAVLLP